MKLKFKVGDKVRILPSAKSVDGVAAGAVNRTGKIRSVCPTYYAIVMDDEPNDFLAWAVSEHCLVPAIEVGQQLVFDFME